MATITPPTTQRWDREESHRRVQHPLQRLRSYIRYYVSAEGLAVLLLYLALWFWIGLLLDFGFFKAFGVDWVQELPWGFRAVLLGGLTAGLLALVAVKVLVRLLREFRDSALALVLERRFPKELGDRLITAVELADPHVAQRYGYSQSMIDQTIRDAGVRIDQLPVAEVFDWPRLRRQGITVAILTLGIYVLVGLTYCLFARAGISDFVPRFNNVASIWFERNVLLANTIWPRRAYLELVGFPESGEIKVGRDAPLPPLRVRALRWVVADVRAPEGWRALRWSDLTPDLLGADLPGQSLPAGWNDWTLDQIELQLDKAETKDALDADLVVSLRNTFERLEERAALPRLHRRLRKLVIPDQVVVLYKGETIRSEQTLQQRDDHEFSGVLSDLRESVRFTVRGEDYYTAYNRITVVPPPTLVELSRDEDRPAYLYHRIPAGGEAKDLRGLKQQFRNLPVSLSGSTSRIDVPAGTDVVLLARTDKPLRSPAGVRALPREGSAPVKVPITQPDDFSFQVRFANVTAPIDLVFEFTDTDNVLGLRHVFLRPVEDTAPEVDVLVEVIRRTNQGYLVTPSARVPFSGKVRDDNGLASVEFAYTLARVDAQPASGVVPVVSALQFVPGGVAHDLLAQAYLAWVDTVVRAAGEESRAPQKIMLSAFDRRLREQEKEDVPLVVLRQRLTEKPPKPLLRDHVLDPEEEWFEVDKLGLKVSDERQVQPHYRMRLWVVAADSNLETGPGVGQSKERFTFLVISENELLTEIAKEEESLHLKLEDTVNRLKDARGKLEQVAKDLPELKAEEFSPMARRAEEVLDVLIRGWDVSREVHSDYRRILKELLYNRVQPGIINKVERNICDPLDAAINLEFVQTDEAVRAFHKTLEGRKADAPAAGLARQQMDRLIDRLQRVLDAMGDVTTINKLIAQLLEIEKAERRDYQRLKEIKDQIEADILREFDLPKKP
jgi:hypothetical protein